MKGVHDMMQSAPREEESLAAARPREYQGADVRANRMKRLATLSLALTGDPIDVFQHIAGMIGELLDVPIVNLSEVRGDELFFLSTFIKGDVQAYTGVCKLENTPCGMVQQSKKLHIVHDVISKFPQAFFLQNFNAYTYCGFPALDGSGNVAAVVCVLDEKHHDFSEEDRDLLNILAHRIGLELERQKHMDEQARKDAELKIAVQRAEEQRDFTCNLLQNSAIATFVLDANHRILIWNRACEELTGMPASAMIGTDLQWRPFYEQQRPVLADIILDGNVELLSELYPKHSASVLAAQGLNAEGWFKNLNNRERYIVFDASPVRDSSGSVIAVVETLQDFTAQKMLEEQVLQSKHDWEDTFNTITDMITVHDKDFNIIRANKAAEQILGLPVLSESRAKCYEHYHGTDCPPAGCASCQSLKSGAPSNIEVYEPHLGKFIEIRAIPRFDSRNELAGLIHVVRDISKRKHAERALKVSEEKFRTLFEESRDVFYISTPQGKFIDINPSGVELFGYASQEELLSIDIGHSLYVDQSERKRFIDFVHQHGYAKDYPVQMKRKDGRTLSVIISSTPLRNSAGEITMFRGVIRDITEQKKLEEQLFHSQKMEAVGQLAGGIAHDFNNILSAIIGYGSIMQMRIGGDAPLRHNIDQILSSANRAADLTKSLLAFSRKQIINPKPLRLNDVIGKSLDFLTRLIGEDIEVRTVLNGNDTTVLADNGQIEQVLMNLATNARDVMPDGGTLFMETDIVELDGEFIRKYPYGKEGRYVLLSVTDSGAGMDEQTKAKIFEPFFTTKEQGKGTGLGLAIVYGIIKQHKGYIHAYSEKGIGTTFKIYLPLIDAEVSDTAEAYQGQDIVGGTETILLAEDDATVRRFTVGMLTSFGYKVIEAGDGDEAVMRFRENSNDISLLLTDVIMPKKNGREAYGAMRTIRPALPALFTSGYTREVMQTKGILDESQDFIPKPVTPHLLLQQIRRVLDRSRA